MLVLSYIGHNSGPRKEEIQKNIMTKKKYNHDLKTEAIGKNKCNVIMIMNTELKG